MCACQPALLIPATVHTPEIVSIIAAVTPGADRIGTYLLTDSATVTIDGAKSTVIKGSGNASVGDLLLTDHASSWMPIATEFGRRQSPGCFDLPNAGVDVGDYVKFTNGLRLRKLSTSIQGSHVRTPTGFSITRRSRSASTQPVRSRVTADRRGARPATAKTQRPGALGGVGRVDDLITGPIRQIVTLGERRFPSGSPPNPSDCAQYLA